MSPDILDDPKSWSLTTLDDLEKGLYERRNIISSVLLAVLSGQSVFLYGPPGTAKSLIANRMSHVFSDSGYFEYLMQRFSTPEEVFGPISISELKKDNYHRLTDNYLPSADIAFLDEIWKSSPAILNTLLTIVNERKFRNGSEIADVPLKAIIAASNEFPASNSGLDALYDRFIVRLAVNPLSDIGSFEKYISASDGESQVSSPISSEVWDKVRKEAEKIPLDESTLSIFSSIRRRLDLAVSKGIYVSDRRWRKAVSILRMSAYLSGYDSVRPVLAYLLKDCFWSSLSDRKQVFEIIDDSVKEVLVPYSEQLAQWDSDAASVSSEIREIFKKVPKQVQQPVVVNGVGCFEVLVNLSGSEEKHYFPYGPKNVGGIYTAFNSSFSPLQFQVNSVNGNEVSIRFLSGSKATAVIPMAIGSSYSVPESTVKTYLRSLENLSSRLEEFMDSMKRYIDDRKSADDSPFIDPSDIGSLHSVFETLVEQAETRKNIVPDLRRLID